jgi:hypothetical protein
VPWCSCFNVTVFTLSINYKIIRNVWLLLKPLRKPHMCNVTSYEVPMKTKLLKPPKMFIVFPKVNTNIIEWKGLWYAMCSHM